MSGIVDPMQDKPVPGGKSAVELFCEYASEFIGFEIEAFGTNFRKDGATDGDAKAGSLALKIAKQQVSLSETIAAARSGDVVAYKALGLAYRYFQRQGLDVPKELGSHIADGYFKPPPRGNSAFLDSDERDAVISFIFENAMTYAEQFSDSGTLVKARQDTTPDKSKAAYEIMSHVFKWDHGLHISASTIKVACEKASRKDKIGG